jgi:hypothetical protein
VCLGLESPMGSVYSYLLKHTVYGMLSSCRAGLNPHDQLANQGSFRGLILCIWYVDWMVVAPGSGVGLLIYSSTWWTGQNDKKAGLYRAVAFLYN